MSDFKEKAREIVDRYEIKDTLCVPNHCISDEIETALLDAYEKGVLDSAKEAHKDGLPEAEIMVRILALKPPRQQKKLDDNPCDGCQGCWSGCTHCGGE